MPYLGNVELSIASPLVQLDSVPYSSDQSTMALMDSVPYSSDQATMALMNMNEVIFSQNPTCSVYANKVTNYISFAATQTSSH